MKDVRLFASGSGNTRRAINLKKQSLELRLLDQMSPILAPQFLFGAQNCAPSFDISAMFAAA